jgi:uncharacterized protein (TIRG00374 family)
MSLPPKLISRLRIACVTASILGLLLVIRQIQLKTLSVAFQEIQWVWLGLALLVFGSLFLPAGIRWQLALKANGCSVSIATAVRISLIGHFFYTILFGAAGGDAAKSALYTRWHEVPFTKTLAASSLDRLLGFAGLICFMALTFSGAATGGAFEKLGAISLRWPGYWIAFAVVIAIAATIWFRRSAAHSPERRFLRDFSEAGCKLVRSPKSMVLGTGCGVAVQFALSGVLALSLAAVSHEPIPWLKLAWTFPVISIISALPITFAGLGIRDSAAVVLLGLYGVSPSNAVAASLLTAAVSLVWTIVGAAVLWREAARFEPDFQFRTLLFRQRSPLPPEQTGHIS